MDGSVEPNCGPYIIALPQEDFPVLPFHDLPGQKRLNAPTKKHRLQIPHAEGFQRRVVVKELGG